MSVTPGVDPEYMLYPFPSLGRSRLLTLLQFPYNDRRELSVYRMANRRPVYLSSVP